MDTIIEDQPAYKTCPNCGGLITITFGGLKPHICNLPERVEDIIDNTIESEAELLYHKTMLVEENILLENTLGYRLLLTPEQHKKDLMSLSTESLENRIKYLNAEINQFNKNKIKFNNLS